MRIEISRVMKRFTFVFSLLLLTAIPARLLADELVLNGLALYQELHADYFLAGLYLPVPSKDSEEILAMKGQRRMELRITFDNFSPRKFAGLWRDSIVINNSPADVDKFGSDMLRFASVMKGKLVTGDRVTIEHTGSATVVSVNNIELARFSGDFFNILLRTWIGPRPASSDFKKDLLGKGNVKEEYKNRFNSTVPLDGRKQLATLWASGNVAADDSAAKAAEEARNQAEAQARLEAENIAKAEAKARQEAELQAQAQAKARAEAQARMQAEAKARSDAEAKARIEAQAAAQAAEEAMKNASNANAKAAAEARAKEAEGARLRAEAESKARAQAEAQAKAEEALRIAAELKAKAEAQARAEAAAKAKAESDARAIAAAKAEENAKKRAAETAAAKQQVAQANDVKPVAVDEENAVVEFDPTQVKRELYKSKLVAWVYKALEYPEKEKRSRREGNIQAKVTITRDGAWVSTELVEETRYLPLNLAAKNATKLAQPYPAMPKDIEGDTFEFMVPILFRAD